MTGKWRRRSGIVLVVICGFGILVGPWPARDTASTDGPAFWDTARRLSQIPTTSSRGPVRAGVAEIDITPSWPVQSAGFIDQILEPSVGINSRCFARALTVAGESISVTIVTADLLLIDAKIAHQVLARTGLRRDEIYFTASHTHSGPGGWGNHPLERLVAGTFDPEVAENLVEQLARVVLLSRGNLQPVEIAFLQTDIPGVQTNRIIPHGATNDTLSAWIFRLISPRPGAQPVLATLASFCAHATIGHPKPSRLGGDYPAVFAESLRREATAGMVLFAAGAVGDAAPIRPAGLNQQRMVQTYGENLADHVTGLLNSAEFHREIDLVNLGFEVDLPPVQVPFWTARLQFSPMATWWIARPQTYLHTLRLGPAWLTGFPGDIASHLAGRLQATAPVVATSFNGDYKGYLVSRETFRAHPGYETRTLSFFGPGMGEFLVALSQASLEQAQAMLR